MTTFEGLTMLLLHLLTLIASACASPQTTTTRPGDGQTLYGAVASSSPHGIEVKDGGRVIVLPQAGADIEGHGPIRFEDGGKVIKIDENVRVLVDGVEVSDSGASSGQRVEVRGPDGAKRWVLRAREGQGLLPYVDSSGVGGRFNPVDIVTDGSHRYWLDANSLFGAVDAEPEPSTYTLNATDGRGTFVIRVENGKLISAELDGRAVPKESIEESGGQIRIRGRDGSDDLTLNLHRSGGVQWRARRGQQGYLGVHTSRPDAALVEQLGLDADDGVLVIGLVEGGPAEKGGLQKHDLVTHVDGREVGASRELSAALRGKKPGERVELRVVRKGRTQEVSVELGQRKDEPGSAWLRLQNREGLATTLKGLGYAGGVDTQALRLGDYVKAYRGTPTTAPDERVDDLVKRLEEQVRRLEERQRELQRLEERLRKLESKER